MWDIVQNAREMLRKIKGLDDSKNSGDEVQPGCMISLANDFSLSRDAIRIRTTTNSTQSHEVHIAHPSYGTTMLCPEKLWRGGVQEA